MSEQLIYKKLIAIEREVQPIAKDQSGSGITYKFRGVEQVYNALHELHAKHGVVITSDVLDYKREERVTKKGGLALTTVARIKWTFYAEDGSSVSSTTLGEGMDYGGDKSANKAMSAALKYSLLQLYLIPTQETANDATERNRTEDVKPGNMSKMNALQIDTFGIQSRIDAANNRKELTEIYNSLSAVEQAHKDIMSYFKKKADKFKSNE